MKLWQRDEEGCMPKGKITTYQRRQTGHGFHLFMTIITVGLWGILIWLPLTAFRKIWFRRRVVTHYDAS